MIQRKYIVGGVVLMVAVYASLLSSTYSEEIKVKEFPGDLSEFKITDPLPRCGKWRENMPKTRDPNIYKIYIESRKLWRSKIEWQLTREETTLILKGVRYASEKGDWGARALLSKFYLQGLGVLESNVVLAPDPTKAVEIIKLAALLGQPWATYDLGIAYEYGYGGLTQSEKIAWAYYKKAAELGSPEAQLVLAKAYSEARLLDHRESMRICAYSQKHGAAAYALGINRSAVSEDFAQSIKYFQDGVEYGDRDSAIALAQLFAAGYWLDNGKESKPKFLKIGVTLDMERSRRYEEIATALEINPDLKLTRIHQVLPLPPAELPRWNGVFDALEPVSDAAPAY